MDKKIRDVKNVRYSKSGAVVGLIVFLTIAILISGNYLFTRKNPGGTDFLVHWTSFRLFFQKGISPYSDQAALAIQTAVYGRAAATGEHELREAYPLYSVLVFGPFLVINNYELARSIWMTFLELSVVATIYFSIRLFSWKPRKGIIIGLLIFSILWYHSLRTVVNGNIVILIGLGLVGVLFALRNGFDELGGVILAFTTIKPQVALVFIAYIFFWAIIRKKSKIILWFFIAWGILVAFSTLLIPDWIIQNIRELIRFTSYNPPGTLQTVFQSFWPSFGSRVGIAINVLIIAMLLIEWWLSRKGDMDRFMWTACLTLASSQWVGLPSDAGNFVIMLPVLVLVFSIVTERWKKRGNTIVWGIMILLFIGLWTIFLATVQRLYQPVQSPIMFLILPTVLILMLYWVKWWVVRPPSVWYDEIKSQQQR